MDEVAALLSATGIAQAMRFSRWIYAGANTAHVLGVALLVGAVVPLNLRFLGFRRGIDATGLARLLVPVAATGAGLAVLSGLLLFLARPETYLASPLFLLKLALVVTGLLHALDLQLLHRPEHAGAARLRASALLSCGLWLGALVAGRMIAYAGD